MNLKYIFVASLLWFSLFVKGENSSFCVEYVQREDSDMVREYISPLRILWVSDENVSLPENLLKHFDGRFLRTKKIVVY